MNKEQIARWAKRKAGRSGLQAVQVEVGGAHPHTATRWKRAASASSEKAHNDARAYHKEMEEKFRFLPSAEAHRNAAEAHAIAAGLMRDAKANPKKISTARIQRASRKARDASKITNPEL